MKRALVLMADGRRGKVGAEIGVAEVSSPPGPYAFYTDGMHDMARLCQRLGKLLELGDRRNLGKRCGCQGCRPKRCAAEVSL